jgi:hypothetical protein
MNNSDKLSYKLLCGMFPGDPDRSVPGFHEIDAFARLEQQFSQMQEIDTLLLEEQRGDWPDDINVLLKMLKNKAPKTVEGFIEHAVISYFSTSAVSRALTGKPSPLFPHPSVMDEIDYNLLEPVIANSGGLADG